MMKNTKSGVPAKGARLQMLVSVGVMLLLVSTGASAADELGDGVCKLVAFLTGKWLFGITLLATAGAGATVMWGAEISDLLKNVAKIITVVGVILGMSSILSMAFTAFSQTC